MSATAPRLLGLRSTTTSRVMAELVARRLVLETTGEARGRGRPAAVLVAHTRRIGASVIYVSSQSLSGALVDLSGHLVAEHRITIASDADNEVMAAAMAELAGVLIAAMPRGMSHAGTAVSLSGLLDLERGQWLMASRWPRMRGLDIGAILAPIAGPVEICRSLDAELRARAAREPEQFAGGTLLLHWGWGIGLAYAVDGRPFAPAGSFGEIGHWRLAALGERRCGCGNTACLETGAALWSLLPALRQRWPDLDEDEARLAGQLSGRDLLSLPEIEAASRLLARALANACRIFFPARIAVSGPFVANPQLWADFDERLRAEGTLDGFTMPHLAGVRASQLHEIHGAAAPLLGRATEALLKAQ
jgi:transcriptional regulator of PTS gene